MQRPRPGGEIVVTYWAKKGVDKLDIRILVIRDLIIKPTHPRIASEVSMLTPFSEYSRGVKLISS